MTPTRKALIALALTIVLSPALFGATGTISPSPFQLVLDNNGNPASLACIWTYTAGTSTPVATYTDVLLSVANANPIIASTAGRFTAFLTPGVSYKFLYESAPCSSISHGSQILSADNIAATPGSSAGVDLTGTAGEALTAGQAVYLSDGSGGKTAGSWYKADTANTYSSIALSIGMVPSSITSGNTGTIRIAGSMTGLSSLTIGAKYYVSTAGAITATAPSPNAREVGQADSTTTLVLKNPLNTFVTPTINTSLLSDKLFAGICQGRLTLTTALPVTIADVTAATTIFFTPYGGANCATYDGTSWTLKSFSELSIAVPATTNTGYDVFLFSSSGTLTLELNAWTNLTTPATAHSGATFYQDGVPIKAGTNTRRYLGSFRTTGVSGQTEDSLTNRFLWNYGNRVERGLQRLETTTSWTYNSVTPHQANAAAANQVTVFIGVSEDPVDVTIDASWTNATSSNAPMVGMGLDSTTTFAGNQAIAGPFQAGNSGGISHSRYSGFPGVGSHILSWNEAVVNSGTAVTFVSNTNSIGGITTGSSLQSGILGRIKG